MLVQEDVDVFTLKDYQRAWETQELARLDVSNQTAQQFYNLVSGTVENMRTQQPSEPLRRFIEDSVAECKRKLTANKLPIADADVLGAVLSAITDNE